MHKFKIEVTKFSLVGAANFILTFIIFTVMLKVIMVNYLLALGAAWIVGTLFSYALNFVWVFRPEKNIQFNARLIKFSLAGLLSIALNMLALRYLVDHTDADPFYLQLLLIPFVVIFNYSTAKFWSLKSTEITKNSTSETI